MTFEATRRKQVLVLQPRGKALYEDDSSFGSKMLAKMGWSKGKGLGKEQHGNLDFIQIRYKNNANGLGYDGLKDNQWTETESQFDNLLKALNGNGTDEPGSNSGSAGEEKPSKIKSLEEQSKQSRARVHYKKFTRGKDVHKYSEKDLANILGKKTLVEAEVTPQEEEEVTIEEEKPVYDSNLIYNTGLSLTDYFKQKMQSKNLSYGIKAKCDSSEENNTVQEVYEDSVETHQVEAETSEKKKKKKKRKLEEAETVDDGLAEVTQPKSEEPPRKKKKSKKNKVEEPEIEEQPAQEVAEEPTKKSKKKKKSNIDEVQVESEVQVVEEPVETKSKKKDKNGKTEASPSSPKKPSPKAGEPERSTGANAVYSTNVITIPSHVAQKMANMTVESFKYSNIANIVGYGLTEEIEIKVVQTKIGENLSNTDKYSLYNTDRMTRQRVNPRKIMSKIKRTKKSIQVI